MSKRKIFKTRSRYLAMLTAAALVCSNVGTCVNIAYAQELTDSQESGSDEGDSSSSEDGSGSGEDGSGSGEDGSGSSENGSGSGEDGSSSGEDGSGSGEDGDGSVENGSGSGEDGSGSGEDGSGSGEDGSDSGEDGSGSGEDGSGSGEDGSGSEENGDGTSEDDSEAGETGDGTGEDGNEAGETGDGTGETGSTTGQPEANGSGANSGNAAAPQEPEQKTSYDVTYAVNPEGMAVVTGDTTVKDGSDLTFTVAPVEGYAITAVTANGVEVSASSDAENEADIDYTGEVEYQVSAVDENLEIEVELTPQAVTLQLPQASEDTIVAEADGLGFSVQSEYFAKNPGCTLKVCTNAGEEKGTGALRGQREYESFKTDLLAQAKADLEPADDELLIIQGYYSLQILDSNNKPVPQIKKSVSITVSEIDLNSWESDNVQVYGAAGTYSNPCTDLELDKDAGTISFHARDAAKGWVPNFSKILSGYYNTNTVVYAVVEKCSTRVPVDYADPTESKYDLPSTSRYENATEELSYEASNSNLNTKEGNAQLIVTIPADFDGKNIMINGQEGINQAFGYNGYVPGDRVNGRLIIQNLSKYDFRYVDNSLGFEKSAEEALMIYGSDDTSLGLPNRISNDAMYALAHDISLSDDNIDNLLKAKGYEGIGDLYKYYIDYYNMNNPSHTVTSLDEIPMDTVMYNMARATHGSANFAIESDPVMSRFFDNIFYNRLLYILPENASGSKTDYTLASYVTGGNSCFEADASKAFGTIKAGTTSEPLLFTMEIEGETGDTYENFKFGFNMGLELEKVVETPPTTPDRPTSGGGSSSGGGSFSGGGSRATITTSNGGPGVTIAEPEVPLAQLPENIVSIPQEEVPLAALPKTGETAFKELIFVMSGMFLGLYGFLGGKRKGEDEE